MSTESQQDPSSTEDMEDSFPPLPLPRRGASTRKSRLADTIPAGTTATADVSNAATQQIGDYDIFRPLGRGGIGTVYLARQRSLNRLVALKVLSEGLFAGPEQRLRFESEALIAAKLQHPNIVRVFDLGRSEAGPYIALEYVSGTTLNEHLGGIPQAARRTAEIIRILALATQHAHQHGIIHRDLKPANVMIGEDGTLKITDFGLARQLDMNSGATRTGEIMGTPSYMSPEQAGGATTLVSFASDVYSLGAIMYEVLTGVAPFRGTEAVAIVLAVLRDDPPGPRQLVPSVPRDLETICLKCLDKQPRRRYASAQELADDLARFLENRPIQARPATVMERGWKWARRRPALAVLVASLLVSFTSFLSYAVWKNGQLSRSLAETQNALKHSDLNFRSALEAARRRIEKVGQPPEQVLTEELEFFDSIRHQQDENAASRYERASAASLAGIVLRRLGRLTESLQALNEAESILASIARTDPLPWYRGELAAVFIHRARVHQDLGDFAAADASILRGLELFGELAKRDPGDQSCLRDQSVLWNNRGVLASQQASPEKAADYHRRAMAIREQLLSIDPRNAEFQSDLIVSQGNLASALLSLNELAAAAKQLENAAAGFDRLPDAMTHSAELRFSRAGIYMNLGNVQLRLEQTDAARENDERGLQLFRDLIRDYPGIPSYQQACADAEVNLGKVWLSQNNLPNAIAQFESALARYEALATAHPETPSYRQQADQLRPGLAELREAVSREPI